MLEFCLALIDEQSDKDKFEELYYTYRQDMYKVAFGILKNSADAEDIVHDSFLIILKRINNIEEVKSSKTRAYITIITKNLAINKYNLRKKHITVNIDEAEYTDDTDVEDNIIDKIEANKLKQLLLEMPDKYYDILFLEYYGLSIAEIAESLNITYESARKKLQRAKHKLINMAKEYFGDER